jgi:hypothetical protein
MPNLIAAVDPPALPHAGAEYDRSTSDQTNNVLRLFFNRLVNNLRSLLATTDNGGRVLYFPRGQFLSTADQAISIINTEQAVTFNVTGVSSGIEIVSSSRITVDKDGVYNVNFMGELDITGGTGNLFIWYAVNGVGAANSAKEFYLSGSTQVMSANINFSGSLNASDYLEVMMAGDSTNLKLQATAAAGAHPGVASASCSVIHVSNG